MSDAPGDGPMDPHTDDPPPPVDPSSPTDGPHDPQSDIVQQLLVARDQVQRSILLLQPVRPAWQTHYDQLRQTRDQLEEVFTDEQVERLRAGKVDFSDDVDRLKAAIDGLSKATQHAARVQDILNYVVMAVEVGSQIVAKILSFI